MALPHAVDTTNPDEVYRHVIGVFSSHGWRESEALMQILFRDIARLFRGEWPGYMACDMRYHDFQHTLQATVCIVDLVDGQHRAGATPHLDRREAEKAVAAALLHDSGFIKRTHEPAGTGAKYTFVHEQRSCEFARAYLPTIGFAPAEVDDVCAAIGCTGPRNHISAQSFRSPTARRMACLLVTADYISQMCAPDYPDKLDHLFAEFVEAFDHEGVPLEQRPYRTATELKLKTPDFWVKFVRPMLDTEADGVHRYFSFTGQPNAYLQAIEDNIAEVRRRAQEAVATV